VILRVRKSCMIDNDGWALYELLDKDQRLSVFSAPVDAEPDDVLAEAWDHAPDPSRVEDIILEKPS